MRARPQDLARRLLPVLLLLLVGSSGPAADRKLGILGQPAPALWASRWFNLPNAQQILDLEHYRGKVIYLLFFQSWCPGCHHHGFPTLQEVSSHYASRDDVVFLTVQTVFEGFHTNDERAALDTVERFGLRFPVGHDPGPENRGSTTMRRYRAGGTPWTVIVDRAGVVRFNAFQLYPENAITKIDALL